MNEKLRRPPATALKTITAGRLKGKSDINPQWRMDIMNEVFGPCGVGWCYDIARQWTEAGADGEVMAFCNVNVQTFDKETGIWSRFIPGTGGSTLVAKEKERMYNNDEAFKMALTDALSVALKAIGVAGDIYRGLWDGSKYARQNEPKAVPEIKTPQKPMLSTGQLEQAIKRIKAGEIELQTRLYNEFELTGYQEQQIHDAVNIAAGIIIETETTILP